MSSMENSVDFENDVAGSLLKSFVFGIVISVILMLLFLLDLVLALTPVHMWGPFGGASLLLDLVFLLCAAGLGALSFFTLMEQV